MTLLYYEEMGSTPDPIVLQLIARSSCDQSSLKTISLTSCSGLRTHTVAQQPSRSPQSPKLADCLGEIAAGGRHSHTMSRVAVNAYSSNRILCLKLSACAHGPHDTQDAGVLCRPTLLLTWQFRSRALYSYSHLCGESFVPFCAVGIPWVAHDRGNPE